ncbi:MAG: MFS transporter [Clostridiales bacterium]|jgi:MFS family permease|nr:MFS transporter [Clostridiales bacterium]
MSQLPSAKHRILGLFIANGLVYGLNTFYNCFIPLYLGKYHSQSRVGIIIASASLVAIVFPLIWGMAADRAKYKNNVLLTAVLLSAVVFTLVGLNQSFPYLLMILMLLMAAMSPFAGLIDTITLEYSSSAGVKYGPIRNTGTVLYGIIGIILSLITGSGMNAIFPAFVVTAIICAVGIMIAPKVEGHSHGRKKFDIKPLFKYKKLFVIYAILSLSMFGWSVYSNFFPTYMTETLGLPGWVWGVNVALSVFGEIPFFLFFDRIFDRLGIKGVLLASSTVLTVRCILIAVFKTAGGIFLTALLTGPAITITMYCAAVFCNRYVEPELKATGHSLSQALPMGGTRVLAALLGGFLCQYLSFPGAMLICAGLAALSLVLWFFFIRTDKTGRLDPKI